MGSFGVIHLVAAAGCGAALAFLVLKRKEAPLFSIADQQKRFALAKKTNNQRHLNIDKFFNPKLLTGKRVLVVGASRGLGLALVHELCKAGAVTIATTRGPCSNFKEKVSQIIDGIDVTSDDSMKKLCSELSPVDVVIYNAGYFYGPVEKIDSLNFKEEHKMIDICAIGSLRVSSALVNANLVKSGGKLALITSQAGSIAWREVQNPEGDNYGHHASRACSNMIGRLLSFEVAERNLSVSLLHPGFNRTEMTSKYAHIYDIEGAVEPDVGARRVLHEINQMTMETSGRFINCEDGLQIPW